MTTMTATTAEELIRSAYNRAIDRLTAYAEDSGFGYHTRQMLAEEGNAIVRADGFLEHFLLANPPGRDAWLAYRLGWSSVEQLRY